jgi:hypothetical protein
MLSVDILKQNKRDGGQNPKIWRILRYYESVCS